MKNITKAIAIALVILGFSATSYAQTATATAAAKILSGLTLGNTSDLNFGTMSVPTTAASVTITPAGGRSSTGTISLLTTAPVAGVASYNVSGDFSAKYVINLPADGVVTISNGATTMAINAFTSSKGVTQPVLDGAGVDTFTVGATLILVPNQAPGSYTGTYDVTVAYN